MAKRTQFKDYKDAYENIAFELSDDGIMLMRCHTDGGSLVWNATSHDELADAFSDIAGDRDVRVVVHTGTGQNYNADWGFLAVGSQGSDAPKPEQGWAPPVHFMAELGWMGRNLLLNMLDIDVPMIAAINGPVNMHSEIPLLCNIVLASEDTTFHDASHFPRGMVPGDGLHIVWPLVVGPTRASYFLLNDVKLTAEQAREWGAVNEVLPKDQVLNRAMEIARELAKRPPMALRYTRNLFTQNFKRACLNELSHGIALELFAQRQFYPVGGGMGGLKKAWDDEDPMEA